MTIIPSTAALLYPPPLGAHSCLSSCVWLRRGHNLNLPIEISVDQTTTDSLLSTLTWGGRANILKVAANLLQ